MRGVWRPSLASRRTGRTMWCPRGARCAVQLKALCCASWLLRMQIKGARSLVLVQNGPLPHSMCILTSPCPPTDFSFCLSRQLEERCRDLDITDLQPFFGSVAFREAGFRLGAGGASVLLARA